MRAFAVVTVAVVVVALLAPAVQSWPGMAGASHRNSASKRRKEAPSTGLVATPMYPLPRRSKPPSGSLGFLEEDDDDGAAPDGISAAQLEVLKEYYQGVPPGHPDRVILEVVDQRLDSGALVAMVAAVVEQIEHMKGLGVEHEDSLYYWNRACTFRTPHQYFQKDCFIPCSEEDDPAVFTGGTDRWEFCFRGYIYKGGFLMTTIALGALHPEEHWFTIEHIKYALEQNLVVKDGIHVATGWPVATEQAFRDLMELRLLRASAMVRRRCEELGLACTHFFQDTSLTWSDQQSRFEAICGDCIDRAVQSFHDLGKDAHPAQVERVTAEFEKWSHALRCTTQEGFPQCLPVDVFQMYRCKIKGEDSEECTRARELEEEDDPTCDQGAETDPLILCPVLAAMAKAEWKKDPAGSGSEPDPEPEPEREPGSISSAEGHDEGNKEQGTVTHGLSKGLCSMRKAVSKKVFGEEKKDHCILAPHKGEPKYAPDATHFWVEQSKLRQGLQEVGVHKAFAWFQAFGVAAYDVKKNRTKSERHRAYSAFMGGYLNIRQLLGNKDVEHGFSTGVRGRANEEDCKMSAPATPSKYFLEPPPPNELWKYHDWLYPERDPRAGQIRAWRKGVCSVGMADTRYGMNDDTPDEAFFWIFEDYHRIERQEVPVRYKSGIDCPKGYPCLPLFLYFWSKNADKKKDSAIKTARCPDLFDTSKEEAESLAQIDVLKKELGELKEPERETFLNQYGNNILTDNYRTKEKKHKEQKSKLADDIDYLEAITGKNQEWMDDHGPNKHSNREFWTRIFKPDEMADPKKYQAAVKACRDNRLDYSCLHNCEMNCMRRGRGLLNVKLQKFTTEWMKSALDDQAVKEDSPEDPPAKPFLCKANEDMSKWRFYREDIRRVVCAAKEEGDRGGEFSESVSKIAETWQMKLATMGFLDGFGRTAEDEINKMTMEEMRVAIAGAGQATADQNLDEDGLRSLLKKRTPKLKELYFTHADMYGFLMEGRFPADMKRTNWERRSWGSLKDSIGHVLDWSCDDESKEIKTE